MSRTSLFQWISDHYPTPKLHQSSLLRRGYRILLRLIAPTGRITLRTPDYRINFCFQVDDIARRIALEAPWEPLCSQVFVSLLRPGMRVLDIGANVGHYTLLAARAVGPLGRVEAFEPFPAHFGELAANVALNAAANRGENGAVNGAENGAENVILHALAVGEENGRGELFTDTENPGGHSICRDNVAAEGAALAVETVSLDRLLPAARGGTASLPVHLIKIDTQGAEAAILRGALETLRKQRPILVMEFWPYGLKRAGESPAEVLALLQALGYRLRNIDEMSGTLREDPPERLLAAYPDTVDYGFTNLLATPDDPAGNA